MTYIRAAGNQVLVSFAAVRALITLGPGTGVPGQAAQTWNRAFTHCLDITVPSYQKWIKCRFPFLFTFAAMYTKQEAARLRQAFWTAFGQYMILVPASGEEKVNWLNFKTGIRHLYFKTEAERNEASVAIVLEHPDAAQQQAHYEQLLLSKPMLEAHTGQAWRWEAPAPDEQGKISSRVYCRLEGVNVFNQGDWPAIISFLKSRLVALEAWWQEAKYGFEF